MYATSTIVYLEYPITFSELHNSFRRSIDSGSFRCFRNLLSKRATPKNHLLQKYKKGMRPKHMKRANIMSEL